MNKLFAAIIFCLGLAISTVFAQTAQCFKNEGLKQLQTVSLTIKGNKVEGIFENSGYDDANPAATFEFTGTKSGNLLTIIFSGKTPYEIPPRTKKIVWTLGKTTLKIPTYGKNYDTNKFSNYIATYQQCKKI